MDNTMRQLVDATRDRMANFETFLAQVATELEEFIAKAKAAEVQIENPHNVPIRDEMRSVDGAKVRVITVGETDGWWKAPLFWRSGVFMGDRNMLPSLVKPPKDSGAADLDAVHTVGDGDLQRLAQLDDGAGAHVGLAGLEGGDGDLADAGAVRKLGLADAADGTDGAEG